MILLKKEFLVLLITSFGLVNSYATDIDFSDFINAEDENASELYQQLSEWYQAKPSLNLIQEKQLKSFILLTESQIQKIVSQRKRAAFKSWHDPRLKTIFSDEDIHLLKHFFTLSLQIKKNYAVYFRTRFECRTPLERGYTEKKYAPSPIRSDQYVRFKIKDTFKLYSRIEKDPGESQLTDHYAGFLQWNSKRSLTKLIIGHYRLNFGLGLTLSDPYGISPNGNPLKAIFPKAKGIQGNSYANEYYYFTGTAISQRWHHITTDLFYARTFRDATLQDDRTVSSWYISGYHRTVSERQKSNILTEAFMGGHVQYKNHGIKLGLVAYENRYSKRFEPANKRKSFYDFKGHQNYVWGLYGNLHIEPFICSAELTQSRSKGRGILLLACMSQPSYKWIIAYRAFDPHFHNPYSYCMGAAPQNLRGWYWGTEFKCHKKIKVKYVVNQYQRRWRTYVFPAGQSTQKTMLQLDIKANTKTTYKIRWIRNTGDIFESATPDHEQHCQQISQRDLTSIRLETRYQINRYWQLSLYLSQIQSKTNQTQRGVLCYMGIAGKAASRFTVKCRFSLFDTDDWQTRVYAYEWDLPGKISIPFYYNQGISHLFLIKWEPMKVLSISARYRRVFYDNQSTIGKGLNQITGNVIHNTGIQLEYNY